MNDIERTKPKMIKYICVDCREVIDGTNIICPHCYSPSLVRATLEMKRALGVLTEKKGERPHTDASETTTHRFS